jgi:DNA repair exonuclease SbcCD ATPase subunit
MLGNNEEILGVDQGEVFGRMMADLPWESLMAYVQANSQVLKACTAGGHRLNPKRRTRVEKILVREAEKTSYSQTMCSGVFAVWYPTHKELHTALEDHFHSDEYKAYREDQNLDEDDYVLSDEKFDEFFKIEDLDKWRILLCFSPLKFTKQQADRILNDSQGNTELLDRLSALEDEAEALRKRDAQLQAEAERATEEARQRMVEANEAKREAREMRAEADAMKTKVEAAQAENRRLRRQSEEIAAHNKQLEEHFEAELEKQAGRLRLDVQRLQGELADWQSKYEDQVVANRQLDEGISTAKKELLFAEQRSDQAEQDAERLTSFADLILGRIDWPKVGAQMKLTPMLRRQFNSLVRKLDYEEDNTLTIEATLPEFWDGLMGLERELVDKVAQSNTLEVATGGVEEFWRALTDAFGDVRISLEARLVLLNMLQEIFYQVLEIEDLEEGVLPKK